MLTTVVRAAVASASSEPKAVKSVSSGMASIAEFTT